MKNQSRTIEEITLHNEIKKPRLLFELIGKMSLSGLLKFQFLFLIITYTIIISGCSKGIPIEKGTPISQNSESTISIAINNDELIDNPSRTTSVAKIESSAKSATTKEASIIDKNIKSETITEAKNDAKSDTTSDPLKETTQQIPAKPAANQESSILPDDPSFDEVFIDVQKNLYGIHIKFNVNNTEHKTESDISKSIKGDWRTSVTINKLKVNNDSIVADMNLTSWEYFKDRYNSKIIEIRDLDPTTNYYSLLDNMYNYSTNEKTDSKTILKNSNQLKILILAHYYTMLDLESRFVIGGKSSYITVPGEIIYAFDGFKKITDATVTYTKDAPDYFAVIIFKPE